MSTVGIDYQQTCSVICISENDGTRTSIRSIGDGQRSLIPHIVVDEHHWGSNTLVSSATPVFSGLNTLNEGPWLDENGDQRFWKGIYQRLYRYLGRVEPESARGYQIVLGLNAREYEQASQHLLSFSRRAGFRSITLIPSVDALLCRWIIEQGKQGKQQRTLAVVDIGDTSLKIRAYVLNYDGFRLPIIAAASQILSLEHTGQAWWVKNLLSHMQGYTNETSPPGHEIVLRDAAIELGIQLSQSRPEQPIPWINPFPGQGVKRSLAISRYTCASWPEVTILTQLPDMLQSALTDLSSPNQPTTLLLGGVGALWPFARDVLSKRKGVPPLWQSSTSQEDVARGAASWPAVWASYKDIWPYTNHL